jgi:hypothetical protein
MGPPLALKQHDSANWTTAATWLNEPRRQQSESAHFAAPTTYGSERDAEDARSAGEQQHWARPPRFVAEGCDPRAHVEVVVARARRSDRPGAKKNRREGQLNLGPAVTI